jgi:hypothetical protein
MFLCKRWFWTTAILLFFAVAANAAEAPVAVAEAGGDKIELFDKTAADLCPEGTLFAVYTMRNTAPSNPGARIRGCWKLTQRGVLLGFEDGDQGILPAEAFTWTDPATGSVRPSSDSGTRKPGVGAT